MIGRPQQALRLQAGVCREVGAPLAAELLVCAADDCERGGPVARVVADRGTGPEAESLGARLIAAVHRLVLSGEALDLSGHFPTAGGRPSELTLSRAFLALVDQHEERLRTWMKEPPRSHPVERAPWLMLGFHEIRRNTGLPLRIRELGAGAGLNLLWDRYRYELGPHHWGPADAAGGVGFSTDWTGSAPHLERHVPVESRIGCDPNPIDVLDPDSRAILESRCWPDDVDGLMRLRRAMRIGIEHPVEIACARTVDWLSAQLAASRPDAVTVIVQSDLWSRVDGAERAAIEQEIARAGARAASPLAWLRLERGAGAPELALAQWPTGADRVLAEASDHGRVVRWLGPDVSCT